MSFSFSIVSIKLFRFIVFFFFCFATALPSYGEQPTPAEKIKVGYYHVPDVMEGASPEKIKDGYVYEIYQKVAEYYNWEYEYIYGKKSELEKKLIEGKIDILAGVIRTPEKEKVMLFPEMELGHIYFYLVKRIDNPDITEDPISYNGKTIGYLRKSQLREIQHLIKNHQLQLKAVKFNSPQERDNALANKKIDAYIDTFPLSGNTQEIEPVALIGREDFYVCIAPHRPDLLHKWNSIFSHLLFNNPTFKDSLTAKYFKHNTLNTRLSDAERQWVNAHDTITVGYLENFQPYCGTDENGKVTGMLPNIIADIFTKLNLSNIKVEYKGFKKGTDLANALKLGEIDTAFPFSNNYYIAEKYNIHLSSPIVRSVRFLIQKNTRSNIKKDYIAVESGNIIQLEHSLKNYPQLSVKKFNSLEDCLIAVHNEQAYATSIPGLIAYIVQRKLGYSDLVFQQENRIEENCLAVDGNSHALLQLLNRGLALQDINFGNNIYFRYIADHFAYSPLDFIKDHAFSFLSGLISLILIICILSFFTIKRSKDQLRIREKYQNKLQRALDSEQQANLDLKVLQDSISPSFPFIVSMNITKGTYNIAGNNIKNLLDPEAEGKFETLNLQAFPFIRGSKMRKQFLEVFNQDNLLNSYRKGEKRITFKYKREFQDNTSHWVELVCMMTEEKKEILGTAFLRLIDEEITAEEKQRGLEGIVASLSEKFAALLHVDFDLNQNDLIFFDSDYNINWDKMAIPYKDMMRYYCERSVLSSDREAFLQDIDQARVLDVVNTGKCHVVRYRSFRNNKLRWLECRFIHHAEHIGKNCVFMGFRDITDEVSSEMQHIKELEEARKKAELANISKTRFLFNMSHDIRTPMNAILGFNNMAIRDIDSKDKVLNYLGKINVSGKMLLTLINDVLETSRIETNNLTFSMQKKNMAEAFKEIEPILCEMARVKKIQLEFTIDVLQNKWAYVDISHTDRILINIISNAIKYTPSGGHVRVRLSQLVKNEDGILFYSFEVQDDGIGMSEEFQKIMFNEFTREENTTISRVQGTGLGLPLAKGIAEKMGGSISCKSKKGEGSTFTITLPFAPCEEGGLSDSAEQATSTSFNFKGLKILLVEDNQLNQEIALDMLEEKEILVTTASDGKEAVDKIKKFGPDYFDAVLMDIQMPVMDGYQATRAIRTLYPDSRLPIIAISANAFDEDKQKSLKAGMDDHIAKPIEIELLFKSLRHILSKNPGDK